MTDDGLYLSHIGEAIRHIQRYAEAGKDAYLADKMRQDAIIRQLEIIGEAVKRLSAATTDRRPDVPWRRVAGMRDRLTHHYFGVDLSLVWAVVENELPKLMDAVAKLQSAPAKPE